MVVTVSKASPTATYVLVGGASLRIPMSYQEYLDLGETKHHEYYDGMCVVNPPTRRHALAVKELQRLLDAACPPDLIALTGWGWETPVPETFEPDLMVFARDAEDEIILKSPPPLLLVEVASRSTRRDDGTVKAEAYARSGAGWYWLVDLDVPEVVVLENRGGTFAEVARFSEPATTPGPFEIEIDPVALAAR